MSCHVYLFVCLQNNSKVMDGFHRNFQEVTTTAELTDD